MATRITSVTNKVSSTQIPMMRANDVLCTARECRPSVRLYVFFDDVDVTPMCTPVGGTRGGHIMTDSSGAASFTLHIDANKFKQGERTLMVTDVSDKELLSLGGNTYGSATAKYNSVGFLDVYQTTTTRVTDVEVWLVDPLAQQFFTYGVKGGIYITAIELFFQQKDAAIPIQVQIRKLINGVPDILDTKNPDLVATLQPEKINISNDASVGTLFRFNAPIYVAEDSDACFVVIANTSKYNIFTQYLGEKSIENKQTIYNHPHIGDMFKSQNNKTWTPQQYEDIKFRMYTAKFNQSGQVAFTGSADARAYMGNRFTTTSGQRTVQLDCVEQHGLNVGDKIGVSVDSRGTYNGIPGQNLIGHFTVNRVIDRFSIEFDVNSTATKSGPIESSGIVLGAHIDLSGVGYSDQTQIQFQDPASGGTRATGTVELYNGKIQKIIINDVGSGYVSAPTCQLTNTGGGSGAVITTSIAAIFTVNLNKYITQISPQIHRQIAQDTKISAQMTVATTNYGYGGALDIPLDKVTRLSTKRLIASKQNAIDKMSKNDGSELTLQLESQNPNVSPLINVRPGVNLFAYNNVIGPWINDGIELSARPSVSNMKDTARYITKQIKLAQPQTAVKLMSYTFSTHETNIEWYIRTSLSGDSSIHQDNTWTKLTCPQPRNKSVNPDDYFDYVFTATDLPRFDVYDLKCVAYSSNDAVVPIVKKYRVIVAA